MEEREIIRLAKYCEEKLSFSMMKTRPEYRYQSLPLCVIDAVFSSMCQIMFAIYS